MATCYNGLPWPHSLCTAVEPTGASAASEGHVTDCQVLCVMHLHFSALGQVAFCSTLCLAQGTKDQMAGSAIGSIADEQAAQLVTALQHLEQVVVAGESLCRSALAGLPYLMQE